MGKRCWAFVAAALALAPLTAQAGAPLSSGSYADAMLIGYDPSSGVVTGYFDMVQGEQPSFSCIFYLHGKLTSGAAQVQTYFPETPATDLIAGVLTVEDSKHFHIQLPSEHGGCWNVEHFADKGAPAEFDLQAGRPWTAIAVVKADKAYLYPTAAAAAHGRAYLVNGDGVGVRTTRAGWIQIDYVGGAKTVTGWLPLTDVYPLP